MVACYFNVNFCDRQNLFFIIEPTALQILACRRKLSFSTVWVNFDVPRACRTGPVNPNDRTCGAH